jgi:polyvinyl alcohol dehydrogenase (cytochrome)
MPAGQTIPPWEGHHNRQIQKVTGSIYGHLRAYSTADGKLLWDIDTERTFTTVNGASAKGGSLDGAGPVIASGMVLVNSGYPRFGGEPGNVLLAFGVETSGP